MIVSKVSYFVSLQQFAQKLEPLWFGYEKLGHEPRGRRGQRQCQSLVRVITMVPTRAVRAAKPKLDHFKLGQVDVLSRVRSLLMLHFY